METLTTSAEETRQLAKKILETGEKVIALKGGLGAGKTTLVQGIGALLGIKRMTSPTFTIIKQYSLETNPYNIKAVYHIDLYRLTNIEEVEALGLQEFWSDPHNLLLIEWPEIIETILPQHLEVKIEVAGPDKRRITINNHK